MLPEMSAFLIENRPPKPQHSSWSANATASTPSIARRSARG